MNIKTCLSVGILALACLIALCPSNVWASNIDTGGPQPLAVANSGALVSTLEQAYVTLAGADHDYHGHRVAAMNQIADAARLLGTDISGHSAGRESQALSDLQIRSVQMALLGVGRGTPAGEPHDKVVGHINAAIKQLSDALASEPGAVAPAGEKTANATGDNSVEIASLQRIYDILANADRDYKGHRVKAMQAIRKACRALGGHAGARGHGKEAQAASDQQLAQSMTLLQQIRDSFAGNDPQAVLNDLNVAVQELGTALSIK